MRDVVCSNNKVTKISSNESEVLIKELKTNKKVFVVEINGYEIKSWHDYISEIQSKFSFPTSCYDSVDRYLDWMRDLQWIDKDDIALIINNHDEFLKSEPELKNEIISDFADIILPFWQEEVKEVVIEGKPKKFMVYLI